MLLVQRVLFVFQDILANKEEEREEDVMESVDEPLINGGL